MAPGIALQVMSGREHNMRVLDPMMGSGTVLAMARAQGHRAIGFDIDPLAVLMAKVWTTAISPEEIHEKANDLIHRAKQNFKNLSQRDAYPLAADEETRHFVAYWFDGYARRQLTALSHAISLLKIEPTRNLFWCALSRLIIAKQAGASLAMDLSHSRPHKAFVTAPTKPFNKFLSAVDRIVANCIDQKSRSRGPAPSIQLGDARDLPVINDSIDLVLTSPPYLNAIDYLRCSKFSLVWMGYDVGELRQLRGFSVGTEAAKGSPLDDDEFQRILRALKLRPRLDNRKEHILAKYVDDMRQAVGEVGRVLRPGGKAIYVIGESTLHGTYIRTSIILSKLAELAGLTLGERRSRYLPANRRYLPPPLPGHRNGSIEGRMRRELVLTFNK
jgi:DNA modification methylase